MLRSSLLVVPVPILAALPRPLVLLRKSRPSAASPLKGRGVYVKTGLLSPLVLSSLHRVAPSEGAAVDATGVVRDVVVVAATGAGVEPCGVVCVTADVDAVGIVVGVVRWSVFDIAVEVATLIGCTILVAEVVLAGEVVVGIVVVAVVTRVAGILRLRLFRFRVCAILLHLRGIFLFLCTVAVNFDFGEARRCDGG